MESMVLVQITFLTEEPSSSVQDFARSGDDKARPQYNNKAGHGALRISPKGLSKQVLAGRAASFPASEIPVSQK